MALRGALRDHELDRDLAVREPGGDEAGNLELSFAQDRAVPGVDGVCCCLALHLQRARDSCGTVEPSSSLEQAIPSFVSKTVTNSSVASLAMGAEGSREVTGNGLPDRVRCSLEEGATLNVLTGDGDPRECFQAQGDPASFVQFGNEA